MQISFYFLRIFFICVTPTFTQFCTPTHHHALNGKLNIFVVKNRPIFSCTKWLVVMSFLIVDLIFLVIDSNWKLLLKFAFPSTIAINYSWFWNVLWKTVLFLFEDNLKNFCATFIQTFGPFDMYSMQVFDRPTFLTVCMKFLIISESFLRLSSNSK
jgi:hypothetical protein